MPKHKSSQNFHNFPTLLSSFIGREREIEEIRQLLLSYRLITLAGAGGSGKTRLALKVGQEVLDNFPDGVWLVELASIADPALVTQIVASTFNLRESSGPSLTDVLVDHISTRQILLVLDNCEHLIDACAQITQTLLQKCPDLKILATSREVLGITGEEAWSVPPLSLPEQQPWTNPSNAHDAVKYYEEFESVQLFISRAKSAYSAFRLTAENGPWVAEICRRLDGLPLAIELAAARVRGLSIQQIAQRLDERFQLLTVGSRTAPPRQQTLLSTLDWSYTLLSEKEQKVLQRLSVFAGSVTLEAAEAVCAGEGVETAEVLDMLFQLVNKSLVISDQPESGPIRFLPGYYLLETIRQYGLDKLTKSGTADQARDRHLNYFVQWAENAESHLSDAEQLLWFEWYEAEHDNLRVALDWCNIDGKRAELGLRLAVSCSRFWRLRGYLSEGRTRISAALSRIQENERTERRARALHWHASLAYLQSDLPSTRLLLEESLRIWRELDLPNNSGLADTLDLLGELATEEGDYATAPTLFEEALDIFRRREDPRGVGDMLMQLGWAYMRMGAYDKVTTYMEEALGLFREIGQPPLLAFSLAGLGELAIRQGQYEKAGQVLEESLAIRKQHGHKWGTAASLGSLGWIALRQHDFKEMKNHLGESLNIRMEIGDKGGIAWCLEKLAEAKYEQAQFKEAAKIFGHAEALRAPIRSVIDPADQGDYNRIISGLRSALGMDAFAAVWTEGAAMPLEDVVEIALTETESEAAPSEKEKFGGLTAREREVAVFIAQGKSNREIAAEMTVGVKTVETYVTRILNKLGFDSRVHIATWAVEKGLKNSVVE